MSEAELGEAEGPTVDDYAFVARAAVEVEAPDLSHRPPMPRDRGLPIALVGAGGISGAHLDAYARYGLNVVAICSRALFARSRAK
jgi:hypothetical protein